MSRTFSTNCGSFENLKFATRCGCNPNACQIRTIALCDSPGFLSHQTSAPMGAISCMDSSVLVTTALCASEIDRGAPGRGSSSNPSSRFTRNRSRHLQTVAPVTCTLLAAAPLLNPSPHAKMMRARRATLALTLGGGRTLRASPSLQTSSGAVW